MATKEQALEALRRMCGPTQAGPRFASPAEETKCREAIERAYPARQAPAKED